ncbi:acyl-CoA synthetase [Methylobrevis albus]|uniref:AMP-binding protein n=1 Tax=Methylobrevis albus TaxID=2793297 RepID=A0A931I1L4_9HYPH|nr:AMP-binding protein [Methylobrevis albus]MBH0237719.1 AMP-binding protein [Methylobrevis albus]
MSPSPSALPPASSGAIPARFNLARHCLGRNAALRPDTPALLLVGGDGAVEEWSYGDLDRATRHVVAALAAEGFAPGDRVLVRCGNDLDFVLAFFAAAGAGLIALPASAMLTPDELLSLALDAGAAAIVLGDAFAGERAAYAGRLPPGCRLIDVAALRAGRCAPVADYAETRAEDPAYLIYTSGTTSRPKGVLHAHRAVLGRRPMHADWLGIGAGDVLLHAGAVNWTYTLGVGLFDAWSVGATTVLYRGDKDPAVWPRLIARFGATIFAAVPTVYRQILKYADLGGGAMATLRHGVTAGESLPAGLLADWHRATGLWLYEAFGMSEISTYVSSRPGTPPTPGSPGRPQRGRRIAVLPREGGSEPLPVGEIGVLAVHRSDPGLMLGYWRRPEEEAAVFRGEWFVGGDLAAFDDDGRLWFHGRADDLMNAMGYRVAPLEVEAALARHPAIAEVAVTETRVREDVSVITAYVVLRPEATADEAALAAFAAAHLAAYKQPRRWVFAERLPRTANGKLDRKALARS